MEDKKLLTNEELEKVVGGLADARCINSAFSIAARKFNAIYNKSYNNMESTQIVSQMRAICLNMSKQAMPSDRTVNECIRDLEELYSALVNTGTRYIPDGAREILDELKCEIGL